MAELLVTRRNDGSYALSDGGLRQAYFRTMHKLLAHYGQNALKKNPEEIKQLLARYQAFAGKELQNPDDYLEKLPQLAQLIGEPNAARFGGFIGQHFLTQLEKTQQGILEAELPKAKDIYENPYRAPSHELLLQFGDLFRAAKPLVWPPPEQLAASDDATVIAAESPPQDNKPLPPPGAILLEKLGEEFRTAKELNWSPQPVPAGGGHEDSAAAAIEEAVPQGPVPAPGERLLQQLRLEFENARPLQWSPQGPPTEDESNGGAVEDPAIPALPVQIQLREFAQLSGMVSRFTKAKDNAGYQQWYSQLNGRSKVILHLNTLVTRSERGDEIYWQSELNSVAQKIGQSSEVVAKMKNEIAAYRQVVMGVQRALQSAVQAGLPGAQAQQLYGQIIALFENKDTLAAKRTALKMTLLAVMVPAAKSVLEQQLTALIAKIGELYPLPEA